MFSLEQIKQAYDKVKTGPDFTQYIQELIAMGVEGYDTYTQDSHVVYYGAAGHQVHTDQKHPDFALATTVNKPLLIQNLVQHQDGQSDYITFCQQAAQCGIAKWRIDILEMTCTYLTAENHAVLIEKIPV
ncbi:DUF1398 domain-containing protein [Flavobacterium crassostreae]|uniref:Phage envelope protein n=1 Tax=Flavobacterium crassostreae TaxID=1763534 RepID=A0A1B9DKI3_9FLAO|nr:DUF1398 family protein [Flavobacterium crassostreae]OCB70212.1 phage envelope protein [Flavobacterium crassostreae]